MSRHDPNIKPSMMMLDGIQWVTKTAYDAVCAKLAEKQRSGKSHSRYFASINDMFENLPQRHADAPYARSADAFRKHGLIEGGFCDVATEVFDTPEIAQRVAPYIAKAARVEHGYALCITKGPVVITTTPHSQSFKAMGKDRFHASVAACEEWAMRTLGVSG